MKIENLIGGTVTHVFGLEKGYGEVSFRVDTDEGLFSLCFYHSQDCCETVTLEDFEGDPADLIGAVFLGVEETSGDAPPDYQCSYISCTWTFYFVNTSKGSIWMRWLGESNGYYSEAVDIDIIPLRGKKNSDETV